MKILVVLFICILLSPVTVFAEDSPREDRPINMIRFDKKMDTPKTNRWKGFWYDVESTKNDNRSSGKDFIKPSKMRWHIDGAGEGTTPYIRCVD